jgi:hypothetical protein
VTSGISDFSQLSIFKLAGSKNEVEEPWGGHRHEEILRHRAQDRAETRRAATGKASPLRFFIKKQKRLYPADTCAIASRRFGAGPENIVSAQSI